MQRRILTVAAIGFSLYEQRVLKSILSLSTSASHSYMGHEASEQGKADIFIVNADNPDAIAQWSALHASRVGLPTIMVAKEELWNSQYAFIQRPLVVKRVLNVLDQVAVRNFPVDSSLVMESKDNPRNILDKLNKSFSRSN